MSYSHSSPSPPARPEVLAGDGCVDADEFEYVLSDGFGVSAKDCRSAFTMFTEVSSSTSPLSLCSTHARNVRLQSFREIKSRLILITSASWPSSSTFRTTRAHWATSSTANSLTTPTPTDQTTSRVTAFCFAERRVVVGGKLRTDVIDFQCIKLK